MALIQRLPFCHQGKPSRIQLPWKQDINNVHSRLITIKRVVEKMGGGGGCWTGRAQQWIFFRQLQIIDML